jgi:hypothetical protein
MTDEKTPSPFNADNHVANHAGPRHRGPSLEEGNLTARQVAYDRLKDKDGFRRPGSMNRHKQ